MRKIALTAVLCSMTIISLAHAGGEGGGGGAGCTNPDGSLKTLYYCGIYQEPVPPSSQPAPVPAPPTINDGPTEYPAELHALEDFIQNFKYYDQSSKDRVLQALHPSDTRRYFTTSAPPAYTGQIDQRIREEFQRVTGVDASNLQLYALTDTNARRTNYPDPIAVTYILPGYPLLRNADPQKQLQERMVALFHEGMWVMDPAASYDQIIAREMTFEALLDQPGDRERIVAFVRAMALETNDAYVQLLGGRALDAAKAAAKADLDSGALDGFVNANGEFSSLKLFGQKNLECFNTLETQMVKAMSIPLIKRDYDNEYHFSPAALAIDSKWQPNEKECFANYLDYLDDLRRHFPKSILLSKISESAHELIKFDYNFFHNEDDWRSNNYFQTPNPIAEILIGPLVQIASQDSYIPSPSSTPAWAHLINTLANDSANYTNDHAMGKKRCSGNWFGIGTYKSCLEKSSIAEARAIWDLTPKPTEVIIKIDTRPEATSVLTVVAPLCTGRKCANK